MNYSRLKLGKERAERIWVNRNLNDDAIASLNVTKFSDFSLYLTNLYVTLSFAIAVSVTNSEIHQNISYSVHDLSR